MKRLLFLLLLLLLPGPRAARAVPADAEAGPAATVASPAAAGPAGSPSATEIGTGKTGEREEAPDPMPPDLIPWHESLLMLPDWMPQEATDLALGLRPANQGDGLFPPELWPLQPAPVPGSLVRRLDREADRTLAEGAAATPVGPEMLALYVPAAPPVPARVLVDPQRLLPEGDAPRMESLVQRWLNERCAFHTTVLIFGAGQLLPADFDPQSLRRQWFGEADGTLLVLYFYGQPERTVAIFGWQARAVYSEGALRSVVDAAVGEAARLPDGAEQFERFCYKLSVRLHSLPHLKPMPGDAAPGTPAPGQSGSRLAAWLVLGSSVLLIAGLSGAAWLRQRRRNLSRQEPVILPEAGILPRFGAPHSGGFAAVVSFARTPPRP